MAAHQRLERRLAEFKGYEAALLFGSGYLANSGIDRRPRRRGDGRLLRRAQPRQHHRRLPPGAGRDLRLPPRRRRAPRPGPARGRRPRLADRHRRRLLDGRRPGAAAGAGRAGPPPRLPADGRRGARDRRDRPRRPRLGRRRRPRADEVDVVVGTLGKALGSYGAYVCADRRDRRVPAQPRPALHLLDRAAAADGRRRRRPRSAASKTKPGDGRAPARQRRRAARGPRRRRAAGRRRADPDRAGRGSATREPDDGALRAGARARRLRPGHPPADGPRRAPRGCASR